MTQAGVDRTRTGSAERIVVGVDLRPHEEIRRAPAPVTAEEAGA